MLKIEYLRFDDLTNEEKEEASDNGFGKEEALYLKISYNNKVISLRSDAMEPEDCTFGRDLNWIKGLLYTVYDLSKS